MPVRRSVRRTAAGPRALGAQWAGEIFIHVSGEGGRMSFDALGRKLKLKGRPELIRATLLGALQDDDRFDAGEHHLSIRPPKPAPFKTRLDRLPVVLFDFETGGAIPGRDRAIELGMVAVENGRITHEWESLFNPGSVAVNHYVLKMTGIKMSELRKAPVFEEMAGEIQAFIGHDVLIAHNLAFDKRFLDAEMYHSTGFVPLNPAICSFQLARRLLPNVSSRGVEGLCNYFGLETGKRHRALDDTRATALIWAKLLEVAFDHGHENFGQLWEVLGQRLPDAH